MIHIYFQNDDVYTTSTTHDLLFAFNLRKRKGKLAILTNLTLYEKKFTLVTKY